MDYTPAGCSWASDSLAVLQPVALFAQFATRGIGAAIEQEQRGQPAVFGQFAIGAGDQRPLALRVNAADFSRQVARERNIAIDEPVAEAPAKHRLKCFGWRRARIGKGWRRDDPEAEALGF